MPNYTDTRVNDMIFNVLDSAQFNTLKNNGELESNQLYFIRDDEGRIDFIKNATLIGQFKGNNILTVDLTNSVNTENLLIGSAITSAGDLNSFLEASKIKATIISNGVTYTGQPVSGNDGEVISIGYSNTTYGNQIFFDPDSDLIAVRRKASTWQPWVKLIHSGNISDYVSASADKWATARKFKISDDSAKNMGTEVSVDGSTDITLPLPNQIYVTGNHMGFISSAETDKFFDFAYGANPTTSSGASWRIGALNSGSGDTNYFVIQTGGSDTSATAWKNALRIGMNTLDIHVGGNLNPVENNKKTLGTSSLKWANVYATTFTGDLEGNAATATKWATARNFAISDSTAAHTGEARSVDGTSAITLPLPATIAATLEGNASSATKAYVTVDNTTKFYLVGAVNDATNPTNGNADLKEDTGLYAGTTKGQLGAAYVGINGDNTSYRLYVNGTSLMTGVVNINTSTGTLQIGSTNSSWTHFTAQRDFYFNRAASFNGNVDPYNDLQYSLGSDSRRWSNVYANVLRLQGAASDPSTTAGARIEFTYDNGTSRSDPIYLAYTPNDSYRASAGLKLMKGTGVTTVWFEVDGPTYSNGTIYANATTDSQSTGTGSIVALGGVGIAKQLRVGGNTNLGGTLGVAGATTLSSTLGVTGATTLNSTLKVVGATTMNSTLAVSGNASFASQIIAQKDTDSASSLDGTASITTNGGISVAKQLSAKSVRIDNGQTSEGCRLVYNETNNCLEFVF